MPGAVGFGTTVMAKLRVEVAEPSFTVNVMVVVPVALATGVIVAVRFAPEPLRTMPLFWTSEVFDELAVTVKLPAAVSVSLMVKGTTAMVVLTKFVEPVMAAIVGRRLIVAVNERVVVLLAAPPSLTVTVIVAEPETPDSAETFNEPVAFGLV